MVHRRGRRGGKKVRKEAAASAPPDPQSTSGEIEEPSDVSDWVYNPYLRRSVYIGPSTSAQDSLPLVEGQSSEAREELPVRGPSPHRDRVYDPFHQRYETIGPRAPPTQRELPPPSPLERDVAASDTTSVAEGWCMFDRCLEAKGVHVELPARFPTPPPARFVEEPSHEPFDPVPPLDSPAPGRPSYRFVGRGRGTKLSRNLEELADRINRSITFSRPAATQTEGVEESAEPVTPPATPAAESPCRLSYWWRGGLLPGDAPTRMIGCGRPCHPMVVAPPLPGQEVSGPVPAAPLGFARRVGPPSRPGPRSMQSLGSAPAQPLPLARGRARPVATAYGPTRPDRCWNCGVLGHRHLQCPASERRVFCYGCGRLGETRANCVGCNPRNAGLPAELVAERAAARRTPTAPVVIVLPGHSPTQ